MTQRKANLTNVDYWNDRQDDIPPAVKGDWIYKRYLDAFMPRGDELSALEVGVYPGRHLLYLAHNYGYRVTGIDFSPHISRLEKTFHEIGIDASIIQADFLEWETEHRFDVVISHGFVEHFENYETVINCHWHLVKPGGLMVISVPVLSIIQRLIRLATYTFDYWRYILDSHNTEIMNLKALRDTVAQCEGSNILVSRHINWMTVWFGPNSVGVRRWTAPLFPMIRVLERIVKKADISNRFISPEIVVAARKSN